MDLDFVNYVSVCTVLTLCNLVSDAVTPVIGVSSALD